MRSLSRAVGKCSKSGWRGQQPCENNVVNVPAVVLLWALDFCSSPSSCSTTLNARFFWTYGPLADEPREKDNIVCGQLVKKVSIYYWSPFRCVFSEFDFDAIFPVGSFFSIM